AVRGERVDAFAEHDRIRSLGILAAMILGHEPAGEVERRPSDPLADTFGDESFHAADFPVWHLGAGDEDPGAVLDAAIGGIGRVYLDGNVLRARGQRTCITV